MRRSWRAPGDGVVPLVPVVFVLLLLGLACSGPAGTVGDAAPGPCFVVPGAMSGVTRSYRPAPDGRLTAVGRVEGGAAHVRAAFHPDGRTLYINSVGPGWMDSVAGRPAEPGVRVRAYEYDAATSAVGPFLGQADASVAAPSNERVYGLVVHPGGEYLYQTTASLGEIRIYDIGPDRLPVLRGAVDATGDGARTCAQVRRLAIDPAGETLYANCNNRDADAPMALQAWRVLEDGGLELLQHLTAPAMDLGVFDPVLHPSGDWVDHPLATTSTDAPAGPGAYVLVYAVAAGGTLVERSRRAATRETRYSSHHGGTLAAVCDRLFFYSYLTDYDTIMGGVLQQFEVGPDRMLVPLDTPWVATGLFDGRQPIPAP